MLVSAHLRTRPCRWCVPQPAKSERQILEPANLRRCVDLMTLPIFRQEVVRQILSDELLSFMLPTAYRMPVSMARNVTQSGT